MSCNSQVFPANLVLSQLGASPLSKTGDFPVEWACPSLERLDKYREEAKRRMESFIEKGMTLKDIAYAGYNWRSRVRMLPNSSWDWAMYEQSQIIAASIGFQYHDQLPVGDFFNDPSIDHSLIDHCGGEYADLDSDGVDTMLTNFHNHNVESSVVKFLKTKKGKLYGKYSRRKLWGWVVGQGCVPSKEKSWGATRHFEEYNPYAGMARLLQAKSFEEAENTTVTIYRGIGGGSAPHGSDERQLESWTSCPEIARLFAEGYLYNTNRPGTGTVVSKDIRFGDITVFIDKDDEFEILLWKEKEGSL